MKYMKRAGVYKASNVTFNPNTFDARSYSWWRFVTKLNNKVIFNNYRYSPSTGRHQRKVRSLLDSLGIKINLTLPLPKGLQVYTDIDEIIVAAEEHLCDEFLNEQLKKQERNLKAKHRRDSKKLQDYLENEAHFRDYEIKQIRQFGHLNIIAVHQIVDPNSIEQDVQNALHSFHRDGFSKVIFYI